MPRRNLFRAPRVALLPVIVVGILVSAPAASAQSAADQYVPQLDRGGAATPRQAAPAAPTPTAPQPPDERAAALAAEEAGGEGSSGGGSILGGDFPLTPFAAGLGAIVLLALLGRALLRGFQRATSSA